MNPEHLTKLRADFQLGDVLEIAESTEGVLNRNYILRTNVGKFFVKHVRDKAKDRVPEVVLIETFMRERGIPAVCMRASTSGERCATYDGSVYCVYPFIESDRAHDYRAEDYVRMGALLGQIHQAGSKEIPLALTKQQFAFKETNIIQETLENRRAEILAIAQPTGIDEVFLSYLDLKLAHLPAFTSAPTPVNSTLIHGDYHAGNLLIAADTREIIGVCDWEKAIMAPRAYELARSILYISFSGDYDENAALATARAFMKGYASTYPISEEELREGFRLLLMQTVRSTWIEHHHYDLHDTRVDQFVEHEARLIRDFVDGNLLEHLLAQSHFA